MILQLIHSGLIDARTFIFCFHVILNLSKPPQRRGFQNPIGTLVSLSPCPDEIEAGSSNYFPAIPIYLLFFQSSSLQMVFPRYKIWKYTILHQKRKPPTLLRHRLCGSIGNFTLIDVIYGYITLNLIAWHNSNSIKTHLANQSTKYLSAH